ncbi:protein kinase [Accumulibacter sp.]|uniref:protein kinase domain-containing protein n=1 Tax=Accumulibacter sp. TaxID=2053492 RepID=UPI002638C99E|nr:protein kinase [Accumulibacter sp.]
MASPTAPNPLPALDTGLPVPPVEASQPVSRQFTPPALGETITVDGKYYFVGQLIGRGSFGEAYECTDEWSNDLVAKILVPRNQTYDEVKENWQQELQKLMHLRHPNITFIHQAFEYKDTFYLIIERCTMTLDAILSDPKLDHELWVPYVGRDILQALDYIHLLGYVHKDIHAGNVFVAQSFDRMVPTKDPVWSFKVGDLGISRLETDIRAFNTLLAQWMIPPEALDPNAFGVVSRSTDIYHAALLLLALMNGGTPSFTPDEVLAGAPRKLAESLPSKFAPAVARALRRHTSARTPTAMQFWRELSSATSSAA